MNATFILAERIAKAEVAKGTSEGRVRNPSAFERKVRDNMLERTAQRGTGWLVEQGIRWDVDIPAELREHEPSREDRLVKRPALCRTCGVCVEYAEHRRVELVDSWPVAVDDCARGYDVADCHRFQERGVDTATRQALGLAT